MELIETPTFTRQITALVSDEEYHAALKSYVVTVVGELLRTEHPRLLFSRQVVTSGQPISFDVDEITIEVFSA